MVEGEKAKRTAQQLLALAHQTSKVTEAYEVHFSLRLYAFMTFLSCFLGTRAQNAHTTA